MYESFPNHMFNTNIIHSCKILIVTTTSRFCNYELNYEPKFLDQGSDTHILVNATHLLPFRYVSLLWGLRVVGSITLPYGYNLAWHDHELGVKKDNR